MSAYTPPSPQTPFDSSRSYGQQPGFVRRNSGKIAVFVIALIAILIAAVVTWLLLQYDDKTSEYTADDYRAGQEQFIELIGEEAFARFEHNHPPLNCSPSEWEANPLACSETWLHRFEIAELIGETTDPQDLNPPSDLSN